MKPLDLQEICDYYRKIGIRCEEQSEEDMVAAVDLEVAAQAKRAPPPKKRKTRRAKQPPKHKETNKLSGILSGEVAEVIGGRQKGAKRDDAKSEKD